MSRTIGDQELALLQPAAVARPDRRWREDGPHGRGRILSLVASAKRDEMRLISVVMGTESDEARMRESQKLLSYGFRYFETHKLYDAGVPLKTARVWYGQEKELALGTRDPVSVTITRGAYDQLQAELLVPNAIEAPVQQGQEIGTLRLTLGDETVLETPLVALGAVEEAGFFSRFIDYILLLFDFLCLPACR